MDQLLPFDRGEFEARRQALLAAMRARGLDGVVLNSSDVSIADLIDEWVSEFGEWDDLGWDPELTAERLFAWLCWGRPAFESGAPEQRAALLRSTARQARLLVLSENELGERHLGLIKAGAALVLAGAALTETSRSVPSPEPGTSGITSIAACIGGLPSSM